MNQNPPPRRPSQRGQQPARPSQSTGLGQPVRRTSTPGAGRPAAPRGQTPNRPLIHPARTARRRRQHKVILTVFVVVILTICMLIGLIFSELATAIGTMVERTGVKKQEKTTTTAPLDSDSDVSGGTSSVSEPRGMSMTTVQMAKEDVATGNLVLVSADHAYVFPSSTSNIVNLFDNRPYVTLANGTKTRAYKVRNSNQSLDKTALDALSKMMEAFVAEYQCTDILVTWAYRSYEDQKNLYDLYVADYPGYSDAQIKQLLMSQVDTPGYSEHHLGTCVDLKIYTDDGTTYTLDQEPGYLSWLTENCWKYGYILRYPSDKTSVTGISYDPYHFRYVAIPHAYYMSRNGLCLEEYLDELQRTTSPDGDHLTVEVDGGATYEIYYVSANSNVVDVPVPTDYPYTVSGDNQNGFIVTVTMD